MKRIVAALFLCTSVASAQDGAAPADAFYSAIRDNDLARLQVLLDSGKPDTPDPRGGATPLMYAGAFGSIEAMTLLLDKGANVNAANNGGATALMWSVTDIDKVRLLLARGANVKAVSERGRTALFLAARSDRSAEIVKVMVAAGADVRAVDGAKINGAELRCRGQRYRDHSDHRRGGRCRCERPGFRGVYTSHTRGRQP